MNTIEAADETGPVLLESAPKTGKRDRAPV